MQTSQATRLVRLLRRYRANSKGKSVWDPKGNHVPQRLIPLVPATVRNCVDKIMPNGRKTRRVQEVPLDRVWSFQNSLRFRSLLYQVKQYDNSQRGYYRSLSGCVTVKRETDLPTFFCWRGKYVIWNGNHRVTAALILGRTAIRGTVYRVRRRKRSTRP